jgi:hypothetical protein
MAPLASPTTTVISLIIPELRKLPLPQRTAAPNGKINSKPLSGNRTVRTLLS